MEIILRKSEFEKLAKIVDLFSESNEGIHWEDLEDEDDEDGFYSVKVNEESVSLKIDTEITLICIGFYADIINVINEKVQELDDIISSKLLD